MRFKVQGSKFEIIVLLSILVSSCTPEKEKPLPIFGQRDVIAKEIDGKESSRYRISYHR